MSGTPEGNAPGIELKEEDVMFEELRHELKPFWQDGVGSPGLIALSDLRESLAAQGNLGQLKPVRKGRIPQRERKMARLKYFSAQIENDRIDGQITLHRASISGYARAFEQANEIAEKYLDRIRPTLPENSGGTQALMIASDLKIIVDDVVDQG